MYSSQFFILLYIFSLFFPSSAASFQDDTLRIKNEINNLNSLSTQFFRSHIDSSLNYSNLALKKSEEINYTIGKIDACCDLGFGFYIKNELDNSIHFNQLAYSLSVKISYQLGIAKSLNNLGLLNWRKGDYSGALEKYKKALVIATEIKNDSEKSRSFNYIGLVYWKVGNYTESIANLFSALEIKENQNDQYEIALTLNNLSNVYNEMGNYSTAITFAKKALKLSETTENNYAIGRALGNLGVSYSKMADYPSAIFYLIRALKIKQKSGEIKGLAYTFMDIANLYLKQDNVELSLEYYNKSLKIMNDIDDAHGLAINYYNLAELYFRNGNYSQAYFDITQSLKYARRENLRESIKNNLLLLAKYYEKLNDFSKSLQYFQAYSTLKDSLLNEINNSVISNLQVSYETAQKEKENELLKQKNTIQTLELDQQGLYIKLLIAMILLAFFITISFYYRYKFISKTKKLLEEKNKEIEKQKLTLEELNRTKDKLFSIIAHDLKNPFQSVLGNTAILLEDYNALDKDERLNIINQIDTVTKSSYYLLENLLQWSLSETGKFAYTPSNINLLHEIEEVKSLVLSAIKKKNLNMSIKIDPTLEVYSDGAFLKTILRNLITNAVKYSNNGGDLIIENDITENDIIIIVEDHGVGMDHETIESLFTVQSGKSARGTSNERGTGLGLIVSRECVQKYGGKIWAESILGKGSKFYFTIPRFQNTLNTIDPESSRNSQYTEEQ